MTDCKTCNLAQRAQAALVKYSTLLLAPVLLLAFRVHWGLAFLRDGKGKLLNHEAVAQFFAESVQLPFPELNAWLVGGVELVGGLLILLGLLARPVALVLTINMLVAYLSVESDRAAILGVLSDAQPFIDADPFFYLLTSALVLAFGPGAISLDALACKLWRKKQGASGCCKAC